ncbi:hypothetical protein JCM10213_001741 [Rhodosporidiobolus nylandii]
MPSARPSQFHASVSGASGEVDGAATGSKASDWTPSEDRSLARLVLERKEKHPRKGINWEKVEGGMWRVAAEGGGTARGRVKEECRGRWEVLKGEVEEALQVFEVCAEDGKIEGEQAWTTPHTSLLLASASSVVRSSTSITRSTLLSPATSASSISAWSIVRERSLLDPFGAAQPGSPNKGLTGRSLKALQARYAAVCAAREEAGASNPDDGAEEEKVGEEEKELFEQVLEMGAAPDAPDGGWEDEDLRAAKWVLLASEDGEERSVEETLRVWERVRERVLGDMLDAAMTSSTPADFQADDEGGAESEEDDDAGSGTNHAYQPWTPAKDRELCRLKTVEKLPWDLVASEMGRSEAAVRQRFSNHRGEWEEKGLLPRSPPNPSGGRKKRGRGRPRASSSVSATPSKAKAPARRKVAKTPSTPVAPFSALPRPCAKKAEVQGKGNKPAAPASSSGSSSDSDDDEDEAMHTAAEDLGDAGEGDEDEKEEPHFDDDEPLQNGFGGGGSSPESDSTSESESESGSEGAEGDGPAGGAVAGGGKKKRRVG